MIKIIFSGALRLDLKKKEITIDNVKNVKEALNKTCDQIPPAQAEELKRQLIFVNDVSIQSLKGLRTSLRDGDEIKFLSPTCGG